MSEMIKIPEGWEQIPLVKACDILMGQSPDGNTINQSEKGYPFLQGNAEFGKKYPSEKNWTTNPTRIAEKDSILLSVRAPVGELNIADKNYCIGRGLSSLTYKSYSLEYLYFAINHNKNQFRNLSQGSTFEAINRKNIEELSILSPKLEKEQQKIAEVLNEVDNAISKIEELFEKNKRLKTALMQDLLSYGIDEKGKIRNPQTHKFKPSELGNIPEEWDSIELEKLLYRPIAYGVLKPEKHDTNGINLIRIQDVKGNKINDNLFKISGKLDAQYSRTKLRENDLILSLVGTLGKVISISKEYENSNISRAFGVIGVKHDLYCYRYIKQLLESDLYQNWIIENARGNAQKVLNVGVLKQLRILIPKSKIEQQKIAQILSSQDEKIEEIKNKLNKLKSLKASLMQDLLSGKVRVTKLMEENS